MLSTDAAVLWDLIIETNIEDAKISQEDTLVIYGHVTDHAGDPISNAQVRIKAGQDTVNLATDEKGKFNTVLSNENRIPGIHTVNIMVTADDGRMGVKSTHFQVLGDISASSVTLQKISTEEAKKYLNADPADFEKDPVRMKLYEHYQKMYSEYLSEKEIDSKIEEEQKELQKQRDIASDLLQKKIEEKKPGHGIYTGWAYERFIGNMDSSVKNIFLKQLNHTTTSFFAAQKAMEEVLAKGGTMEEARKAYFDKVSITRKTMDNFTIENTSSSNPVENTTNTIVNKTSVEYLTNSTLASSNKTENTVSKFFFDLKNATVKVESDGKVVVVNVNGTELMFAVNGTEIYQITNKTK